MSNKLIEPRFFFDTADADYIRGIWDELDVPPESVEGITTNPNAMSKIGVNTLAEFEETTNALCSLVTEIRDGKEGGLVYVQAPNSRMKGNMLIEWAHYVRGLEDGCTAVGLKIPHFNYALDAAKELQNVITLNVTGIADWGTIMKALSCPWVTHASLIPGRMEEKNIDAKAHMKALIGRKPQLYQDVIAGSMRTIEGLQDAIWHDTIPTIGARVWDQMLVNPELFEEFPEWWDEEWIIGACNFWSFAPVTNEDAIQLSVDFFDQMDNLGWDLYSEFKNK